MPVTPEEAVKATVLRLNARAWGISFGLVLGGGLFLATIVLVLRGGAQVGQHLGMLSVFLPGYRVTWARSSASSTSSCWAMPSAG